MDIHQMIKSKTILICFCATLFSLLVFGCSGTMHPTSKEDLEKIEMDPKSVVRGKVNYEIYCQECHGSDGAGNPDVTTDTKMMPASLIKKDLHILRHGMSAIIDFPHYSQRAIKRQAKHGGGVMPPLKEVLGQGQLDDLANYITSLILATYES